MKFDLELGIARQTNRVGTGFTKTRLLSDDDFAAGRTGMDRVLKIIIPRYFQTIIELLACTQVAFITPATWATW